MISACIRKLGWDKDIIITLHGVSQKYVDRTKGKNKFLYICNILNMKLKTGAPISYVTTGQNVPDDIEVVDTQKLVKQLLGGK